MTDSVSKRYGTHKGPIWDFISVLYGHPYGTEMGFATARVLCGIHMDKPKWVANGNHMGPILDLVQVAHVQPAFGK